MPKPRQRSESLTDVLLKLSSSRTGSVKVAPWETPGFKQSPSDELTEFYGFSREAIQSSRYIYFSHHISTRQSQWRQIAAALENRFSSHVMQALAELNSTVERQGKKLEQQEKKIQSQESMIRVLQDLLGESDMPPLGDFEKWCETPEAEKYAGRHVAFVPGEGVIESSESLGALLAKVRSRDDAVVGYVPYD